MIIKSLHAKQIMMLSVLNTVWIMIFTATVAKCVSDKYKSFNLPRSGHWVTLLVQNYNYRFFFFGGGV